MEHSGNLPEMYGRILQLQSRMPTIPKTSTNPHFKSKYADLPTIMEIVLPIAQELGLVIMQPILTSTDPHVLRIETVVCHPESGSFISVASNVPIGNNLTPQAFGSAITYARRYVLCSLLGIVADEDDDGNASSISAKESKKASSKPATPAPGKSPAAETITEADAKRLYMIARNAGYSTDEVHNILSKRGIYNAKQLTTENYVKFCNWLEANRKDDGNG